MAVAKVEIVRKVPDINSPVGGVIYNIQTSGGRSVWNERVGCSNDYGSCPVRLNLGNVRDMCFARSDFVSVWCGKDPRAEALQTALQQEG